MMMRSKVSRWAFLTLAVAGLALGTGNSVRDAYAQEVKCYLMVCTGSVCVANQVPCPAPPQEETPKNPLPGGIT